MAARRIAAGQRLGGQRIDDGGVLAVNLEHPAMAAHGPQGGEQSVIGQSEVEDHERLGGGDARRDKLRQLRHRVVLVAGDDRAESEVDYRLPFGARPELAHSGEQRARPLIGDAGAGVVEREERGGATECGCHAVLEEAIRLIVGRQPGVGMDVHASGKDQHPGRIKRLGTGRRGQARTNFADPPVGHRDVSLERALGGDHGSAADDQVGQSVPSVISMSWAPSHRTRRPISGRCSLPLTTVAKWLPASWPSLLEKSQAP